MTFGAFYRTVFLPFYADGTFNMIDVCMKMERCILPTLDQLSFEEIDDTCLYRMFSTPPLSERSDSYRYAAERYVAAVIKLASATGEIRPEDFPRYFDGTPFKKARRFAPRPDETFQYISDLQLAELLKDMRLTPYHAPVKMAVFTGLGTNELLALVTEDYDREKQTLSVNKRYHQSVQPGGEYEAVIPQTEEISGRIIQLCRTAAAHADSVIAHRDNNRAYYGNCWHGNSDRIFLRENGFPYTPKDLNAALNRSCLRTGVPVVNMRDIRRNFAVRCLKSGMSPQGLIRYLGFTHANGLIPIHAALEYCSFDGYKKEA